VNAGRRWEEEENDGEGMQGTGKTREGGEKRKGHMLWA